MVMRGLPTSILRNVGPHSVAYCGAWTLHTAGLTNARVKDARASGHVGGPEGGTRPRLCLAHTAPRAACKAALGGPSSLQPEGESGVLMAASSTVGCSSLHQIKHNSTFRLSIFF